MAQGFALVMDLLYWTMLAASTVGPGTIIMMAKSGADFQLKLAWVVIPASIIAYVTQEGAARLFIVSGLDFGGAIQTYFQSPVINYGLAFTIVGANCALEAGQVVGALEAAYEIYRDESLFRILMAVLFGVTVATILLKGNVDMISKALGTVVVVMVVTFSIGAAQTGANGKELAEGLFFPQLGTEEIPVALSMIATTALPFNPFLASSLAKGYSVPAMQRGILFSTALAAVLSLTIIIVGSGVEDAGSSGSFAVKDISIALKRGIGPSGSGLFVFGLFFASFSSALTIALGAYL
jgi:NRAMP (natural resistance-associated macrophage protein)-like metal ion transporter